jgi:hypothetical protein
MINKSLKLIRYGFNKIFNTDNVFICDVKTKQFTNGGYYWFKQKGIFYKQIVIFENRKIKLEKMLFIPLQKNGHMIWFHTFDSFKENVVKIYDSHNIT